MRIRKSGVIRTSFIASALAMLFPLSALGQQSAEATQLDPVTIRDTADSIGYVSRRTASATKSESPLIETPMAVQAVPKMLIDDRAASSAIEALGVVSGVQTQPGAYYDQYQIRGFGSGYGISFRNGLQLEGIADAVNMSFVDRVEVVKGPASVLYGRVEPGGFVNIVTKKPEFAPGYALKQQFGSWGNSKTTLDATGPLGEGKTIAYRLIADYDRGENYVKNDRHERKAASGALAFRPSDRFEFNINLELYDYKAAGRETPENVPIVGDRPDSHVPRSSGRHPASWDAFPDTVQRTLVGFDWTYAFNEQWKLTQRFHYVDVDEIQANIDYTGSGTYGFVYNWVPRRIYNTNLDLSGQFSTGALRHNVLLGIDAFGYKDDWKGYVYSTTIPEHDVYNPVFADIRAELQALKELSRNNVLWRVRERNAGIYFQDQIEFTEHWRVLLGGRYDRASTKYARTYGSDSEACFPNCTGDGLNSWPDDKRFSPRAAVLYKLTPALSLYASYSKSFGTNNSSYLSAGEKAAPEIGEQYEVGVKASLLDDRVFATATVFDLTKRNIMQTNPADPFGPQIPIGKVRSRGLELDVAGQITRNVTLVASYTYNAVKIEKDTTLPQNEGNQISGTPRHAAALWAKFDTAPGEVEGWTAGLGIDGRGQRQGDNENSWQIPGYATVDLMAGYRTRIAGTRVSAQLNLKNAFDRDYFERIGWGTAGWGAPRSLVGSVRVDF